MFIDRIGSPADVITITPVTETTALDAGDVVFATTEIPNIARLNGGTVRLDSVMLIDTADQKADLHLVFFKTNVALGTLDAAPNINDTNILEFCGYVGIVAANYIDVGGASVVQLNNIGRMMKCADGSRSLYVAAFTPGTPTYGAAGALVLSLGVAQS